MWNKVYICRHRTRIDHKNIVWICFSLMYTVQYVCCIWICCSFFLSFLLHLFTSALTFGCFFCHHFFQMFIAVRSMLFSRFLFFSFCKVCVCVRVVVIFFRTWNVVDCFPHKIFLFTEEFQFYSMAAACTCPLIHTNKTKDIHKPSKCTRTRTQRNTVAAATYATEKTARDRMKKKQHAESRSRKENIKMEERRRAAAWAMMTIIELCEFISKNANII